MTILVVSGTGTEIGKTVVTAAVAAAARGRRVAVLKPAQTGLAPGEPGDAAEVARLAGGHVTAVELARFPDPLAPATAARRAGLAPVRPHEVAEAAEKLATEHDLVLVEGAGGLLVRFDDEGGTLADAARLLSAPVLVVAPAGLGTLNATALTAEALRARGIECLGVVVEACPAAGPGRPVQHRGPAGGGGGPAPGSRPGRCGGTAGRRVRGGGGGLAGPGAGGYLDRAVAVRRGPAPGPYGHAWTRPLPGENR
ncbi:ATP-dependent dethiobiotin synthetase BioD [Streptomyces microflavus]